MRFDLSLTALATAFAFLLGFVHLAGFWSNFEIGITTIFSFTSAIDILKAAFLPSLLIVLFSCAHVNLWDPDNYGAHTYKIMRHNEKFWGRIMTGPIICGAFCALYIFMLMTSYYETSLSQFKLLAFATGFGWIMFTTITMMGSILPNLNITTRSFIFALIIFSPHLLYMMGLNKSFDIINGKDTVVVVSDKHCSSSPSIKFRYIASYSDKILSYSPDNKSVCISNYDSAQFFKEEVAKN